MKTTKKFLSVIMAVMMVLSYWVWAAPEKTAVANAATKNHYLFAYFTGNSSAGQTVHLAVSEDGLHYTALRNNEPVIIPSKGTGAVRDPYLWFDNSNNEGYYYLIGTDMDSSAGWSDCCNGFIIWRSKDLIHWTDETFISAYDILHKIDPNITNVKKAWAPQIMHDGNSYIVYFSLETNLSNEKLSIVYLKTDDLLNQENYGDFGTIYAPADTSVNDAEIVKYNNEWYLFYKREGVSPERIFMRKASSYTGFANSSVNLDVFSSKQEALEGSNGFFKPDGTFILYADAYWHDNNPDVPYFYVATTKDFNSWNIQDESAHNINSLSPRHGSVVPITKAEYDNLLLYTQNISSSSLSATEKVIDHMVARYFTTDNVRYNAAPGKEREDLTVKNGLETHATTESGLEYYANFNTSEYATVDLNALLPDSFNYDDGFTITFKAKPRGAANSRFFSIKNGTTSTDITCWGGNSGLFACVNDGVVEATSAYYNDNKYHDYMITYANGNLIVYVDGNLLIKENRFTVSSMDRAWFEALGNGTLAIGAYVDGGAALDAEISDFRLYDCAISYYDAQKTALELEIASGKLASASIVVPETIYMTPSTGASTTGQYYVNNEIDKNNNWVVIPKALSAQKVGYVQFKIDNAKSFKVEVSAISTASGNKIGDVVLTGINEGTSYDIPTDGFYTNKEIGIKINETGLNAKDTAVAEWKFTITMNDGSTGTYYAYSTLYAPYIAPVGAATWARAESYGKSTAGSMAWVSGVHGYVDNSTYGNQEYWYANLSNFMPIINNIASGSDYNNFKAHTNSTWIINNNDNGLGKSMYWYDGGTDNNHRRAIIVGPVAQLTMDLSRNKNLNEIPNFEVGFSITSSENSDSGSWYLDDYTGKNDHLSNATAGGGSKKANETQAYFNTRGINNIANGPDKNCELKYDGQWNKEVEKSQTLRIKGALYTSKGSTFNSTATNLIFVDINVTATNKADLRKLVLEGASFAEQNYTTASWNNFKTALQDAATALGNPTAVTIDKDALDTAIENLEAKVTLNANGGQINDDDGNAKNTAVVGVTVGRNKELSVPLADYKPTHNDYYTFMGWAPSSTATNGIISTISSAFNPTFYAVWAVNSKALNDDKLIMDFDGFEYSPFVNDTNFTTAVAAKEKKPELLGISISDKNILPGYDGEYSSFTVDSKENKIIYYLNPSNIFTNSYNAFNSVWYHASYEGNDNLINPIFKSFEVAPASNVLFEDTRFEKAEIENNTGNVWAKTGSSGTITLSENNDINSTTPVVYGYNESYTGNVGEYSNGTALVTTVDSDNRRSQIQSFTFTGTGFDLYGQCADDTGIMVITLKKGTTAVKAFVVDTFYNGGFGTLNQVPIATARDLPHDTYTLQVAAMYMSTAGAARGAQNAYGLRNMVSFAPAMSTADMLYEALCDAGLEEVFEVDDLEINWFDDASILNGDNGASTFANEAGSEATVTNTESGLVSVIDSVRVYNPLNPDFADEYYIESEQGAKYFNVMDNLDNDGTVSGKGTFTYVDYTTTTTGGTDVNFSQYKSKGSHEEFYLTNTGALTFTVKKPDDNSRIMVSLRAAAGTPSVKIGGKTITVNSSTEMYYDITNAVYEDGTVTIQNTGDGLLAIGNVKVTNCAAEPVMMSTFNMRSARMMMMAPPAADEPEVEEETTTEETTTEEETTEEVTTEEVTTEEATTEEATTEEAATEEATTEEVTTEETTTEAEETTTEPSAEEEGESFLDKLFKVINLVLDFIPKLISKIMSMVKA